MRSFFVSAVTSPRSGSTRERTCPPARSPSSRRPLSEDACMALGFEIGARLQGLGPVGEAAHAHDVIGRAATCGGGSRGGRGAALGTADGDLEAFLLAPRGERHGRPEVVGGIDYDPALAAL